MEDTIQWSSHPALNDHPEPLHSGIQTPSHPAKVVHGAQSGLGIMLISGAGVQIATPHENPVMASPAGHAPSLKPPIAPQREYDSMSNAKTSVVRLPDVIDVPSMLSV